MCGCVPGKESRIRGCELQAKRGDWVALIKSI